MALGASAAPVAAPPAGGPAAPSAFAHALGAGEVAIRWGGDRLVRFLAARGTAESLRAWFGELPLMATPQERDAVSLRLNAAVAEIDSLVNEQLSAVLAHPDFAKLESSWRGLRYLVGQCPEGQQVKVRVLSASWAELSRDQARAIEFDQSHLFRKVYSDEFGTPGGQPFGLLVGDYALTPRPGAGHPTDDVATLAGISAVAAAAFAPFVAGAAPSFLGADAFAELDPSIDLARATGGDDHRAWRRLRDAEDVRFVALAVPRMVLRLPHDQPPGCPFPFAQPRGDALYGNAAWALAAVAVRAFAESGWLADIRGVGGAVASPTAVGPQLEVGASAPCSADAHFTDRQEKELADLGFTPLCHRPGTGGGAAFYTVPTCQKPKPYDDEAATANAKLGAMLPYILCVSRIGHYLKVLMRDRVGAFTTAADTAEYLRRWLARYVVSNDSASVEMKARYPLREAAVEVRDVPGRPGHYRCTVHLRPHYQLESLSAGIKLTTELSSRP